MTYVQCPFNLPEHIGGIHSHFRCGPFPRAYFLMPNLTMLWDNILIYFKISDKFYQHSMANVFLACCKEYTSRPHVFQQNKLQHLYYTKQLEKKHLKRAINKQMLSSVITVLYYQKKISYQQKEQYQYIEQKNMANRISQIKKNKIFINDFTLILSKSSC